MTLEDCTLCEKHGYSGNGFVICKYYNMNEQRITGTGVNNAVNIISCPKEDDVAIDRKNDYPPRWGKKASIIKK
ncbi:MAG: hypothetical protein EPN93_20485 [Spirochaetes bacterium]|nr:MAG: hypothetical protein EPN93_20485 [Spirochaetota bacterium]